MSWLMLACSLIAALWSPARKGLLLLTLLYMMFSCAFVTFPHSILGLEGATLIFQTYVTAQTNFRGFKVSNFNIFEGFQKNDNFWGIKILWIFFGVITKLD